MSMTESFTLQWFPGHMAKAKRELGERVKHVDFLIEVADARAPESTRNPDLDEIAGSRPRLLVLAKSDLAESGATRFWLDRLTKRGEESLAVSIPDANDVRRVRATLLRMATAHQRRGGRSTPLIPQIPGVSMPRMGVRRARGIVVGMPNTGKSSLIRALGGGGAKTGDRPGVTRAVQEIAVSDDVMLLDTPGLMWPRAARGSAALRLAWLGYVGERAYDPVEAARTLLDWLAGRRRAALSGRYGVTESGDLDPIAVLEQIATRRGRQSAGSGDVVQGALILLREFRSGELGRFTLDVPGADDKGEHTGE